MKKKNIVITGAGNGVGQMLAIGFAKNGANIICIDKSEEGLAKTVETIKDLTNENDGDANFLVVDMMDQDAVKAAGEKAVALHGSIDVWINNVGVNNHNAIGPTWEIEPQNWWTEVSLNLYTAFIGTHTAIKMMQKQNSGYVINLGGGGVQEPKPFGSSYGAAKTALVKFTETVNIELQEEKLNIKVFAFNPGFIRNERTEKLVESDVARKYMPKLEEVLKHGEMSDIQDSIDLIEALISGRADELGGKYFFADDKNIEQAIKEKKILVEPEKNVLRVRL